MSSNYQLPLIKQNHQNHYLFSDHYLAEVLRKTDNWKDEEGLKEAFQKITETYAKVAGQLKLLEDERRNEENFIMPVLKIINPYFQLQPRTLSIEGKKRPDYAFFSDKKTKKEADKNLIQEKYREYFKKAIAVGDAKYWDRPLDRKDTKSKDAFTNHNPNYQIDFYLRATNLKWGILTNGRLWRIYNRETSFKLNSFYQVDLPILIQQNDLECFKYFYHFFRLKAFLPDAQGECFLDKVYKSSLDYATQIGDELKSRVYDALEEAANGFLNYPDNKLTTASLEKIRENCLILLYRLLFILYAESRSLLPIEENTSYRMTYSLDDLKKEIAKKLTRDETLLSSSVIYWSRLKNLFQLINKGDKNLNVPEYNGGLFKPEKNLFLEKYNIGDSYLSKVIDLLSRTPTKREKEERLEFVSFRDLEIRHLGSIYEGLLEHRLIEAKKIQYVIKEKRKEKVVSADQTKNKKILKELKPGEIYLATDKSERKATGSYYTPDYIVKYIVENTLGPLSNGKSPEEILELNVLDPAMGSGHFLVRATEFLAEAIATHPEVKTQEGMDDENELNFWKRQIVERCIYGVDLNPLAVELAKLSLWLATVAKGKPLSFLDHHLRCGNSLIGAKLKDLGYLPVKKSKKKKEPSEDQLSFIQEEWFKQDVWHFLKLEKEIELKESITKKAIDEKYSLLATLEKGREKYKKIADLWTSSYFGNLMYDSVYRATVEGIRDETKRKLSEKAHKDIFNKAGKTANEKRFFHWELEFPEIFFDEYGRQKDNPGFDAVIGNPPYGATFDNFERKYIEYEYEHSKHNKNSAMVFIERSLAKKRESGFFSFIIPKSLAFSQKWAPGRDLILKDLVIAADASKAFEEVLLEQAVIVISENYLKANNYNSVILQKSGVDTPCEISKDICLLTDSLLLGISKKELQIFNKVLSWKFFMRNISVSARGLPFQKYVNKGASRIQIFRGDHIARYMLFESDETILKSVLEKVRGKVELLSQPKILSQRIVAHVLYPVDHIILMSTLDNKGVLTLDTIENTVVTDKHYSLAFITSLMNSFFSSWYAYRFIFGKAIRTMDFDDYYIGKLPIRRISFTTSPTQRAKLLHKLEIIFAKVIKLVQFSTFSSASEFRNSKIGKMIYQYLISTPEKSDVVHDFLAFLAEQMIKMNKEKQKEVKGFLKWLAGEIKTDIERLKLKTKVKDYHDHNLETILGVLRRNRIKIGRTLRENIENEFNSSLKKLRPLKTKIGATDNLIDQIVYLLYGLTEDEIKIVEGKV